jgi:hypothetical protein
MENNKLENIHKLIDQADIQNKSEIKEYFARIYLEYLEYLQYKRMDVNWDLDFVRLNDVSFSKILKINRDVIYNIYTYNIINILREFLYKGGIIPGFEKESNYYIYYEDRRDEMDEVKEVNGQHFTFRYFLWVNENDKPANPDEIITKDNFLKYLRPVLNNGWSKEQLVTFIRVNIIPTLLQKFNLNININNPSYIKCLTKQPKYNLRGLIRMYINGNLDYKKDYYHLAKCLKYKQSRIQKGIKQKIKRIVNKKSETKKRYKWENLCGVLNKININDLYELAAFERIPYYSSMTRRELCAELSKLAAERMVRKGKIEHKCINEDSVSGDSIKDIPAEFFVSFYDNDKLFCEDIRSLYNIVKTNSIPKNPWNGVPFSKQIVNLIESEYYYLTQTVNTFEDLNVPEQVMSNTSLLSSKTSDLLSLLNYPKPAANFINATKEQINTFIQELTKEFILDPRDNRILQNESDSTIKLTLINLLIEKIKNDRNQIQTPSGMLSGMAINISNVYNEVF